jgi:hypothetical protein
MAKFNAKISAEFTPPKTWVLERALSFETDQLSGADIDVLLEIGANVKNASAGGGRITCKKGMKTDLASTPRILWNLIAPWDVARAAIIHDHLYAALRSYYKDRLNNGKWSYATWKMGKNIADKVFLLGMLAATPSVPKWKIYPSYWAVKVFGRKPASTG